jgi:hypothetical protein
MLNNCPMQQSVRTGVGPRGREPPELNVGSAKKTVDRRAGGVAAAHALFVHAARQPRDGEWEPAREADAVAVGVSMAGWSFTGLEAGRDG